MAIQQFPKLRNLIERLWPIAVSLAIGVFFYFSAVTLSEKNLNTLFSSTISISAILMGFLGTSKAILLSYSSRKLTWLKSKKDLWQMLIGFFKSSFLANLTLCIFTLILLSGSIPQSISLDIKEIPIFRILCAFWIALTLYAITSFYRVIDIFFALLSDS